MKYGIRECADVVLRAKHAQKIGNKIFYKDEPVCYFDTLKTSSLEGSATTVYAQGGRGNSRLMSWDGERNITFTMENALISPEGLAILTGAGLISAETKHVVRHMTKMLSADDIAFSGTLDKNKLTVAFREIFHHGGDLNNRTTDYPANKEEALQGDAYYYNGTTYYLVKEPLVKLESDYNNITTGAIATGIPEYVNQWVDDSNLAFATYAQINTNKVNYGDANNDPTGIDGESLLKTKTFDSYQELAKQVKASMIKALTESVSVDGINAIMQIDLSKIKEDSNDSIYLFGCDAHGEVITEPFILTKKNDVLQLKKSMSGVSELILGSAKITSYKLDYYEEHTTGAFQIDIEPDKFGGSFYLEASTLWRDLAGQDHPAEFIIPNCRVQSNFTFTMASSGDPSSFTFTLDAFPDYTRWNKTKKVLAQIQVFDDLGGSSEPAREETWSNDVFDEDGNWIGPGS